MELGTFSKSTLFVGSQDSYLKGACSLRAIEKARAGSDRTVEWSQASIDISLLGIVVLRLDADERIEECCGMTPQT